MYGIYLPELFTCIVPFLALAVIAFWIWMLVDCLQNEPSEGNDKIAWLLVIILTSGLGALIYFILRRPERIRRFGR
ncbi:MAG: PLDc N-terminal domain-containing protein [Ktedonobacteraceae bacterium]